MLKQVVDPLGDGLDLCVLCRTLEYCMESILHHIAAVGSSHCMNRHDQLFSDSVEDGIDLFF